VDRGPQRQLEGALQALVVDLERGRGRRAAGVGDQDLDRAIEAPRGLGQVQSQRAAIGHVERRAPDALPVLRQGVPSSREPRRIAPAHRHRRALGEQGPRRRQPEPAGRSQHRRRLVPQSEIHVEAAFRTAGVVC